MKKQLLIIGPGMEIGGVEKSLIGLLNTIDYEVWNADLFLFSHTGELMPFINPNIHILPPNTSIALINRPIKQLLKEGHLFVAFIRLSCKLYGDLKGKLKGTQSNNILVCKKVFAGMTKPFPKHYDFALGFFGPHYILTDKVDADVKVGWAHTDYTNANEKPDLAFITPMWEKLDYIACVSPSAEASFQKVFPSLADRTIVIENIVSLDMVRKQAEEYEPFELKQDDAIRILSVGRYCNAKAFDMLPEVCSKLIEKGYHIKWYLIGYGPDEQLIRSRINEFGMEEHVILLGKKTNPYPYMRACDIYAQPSRYEGKAVTVTEAQILHKPVMITRYATAASQVKEGIDGYICEMGVDGIVNGVAYMIDHPEFRRRLIDGTAKRNYDQSKELEKIWSLHRR